MLAAAASDGPPQLYETEGYAVFDPTASPGHTAQTAGIGGEGGGSEDGVGGGGEGGGSEDGGYEGGGGEGGVGEGGGGEGGGHVEQRTHKPPQRAFSSYSTSR
jgi:hypothetical protein